MPLKTSQFSSLGWFRNFVCFNDRTRPFMPLDTYRSLPLRSLYDLSATAARDLAAAVDAKQDREIALKAMKKQVEILLQVIDEKKRELTEST